MPPTPTPGDAAPQKIPLASDSLAPPASPVPARRRGTERGARGDLLRKPWLPLFRGIFVFGFSRRGSSRVPDANAGCVSGFGGGGGKEETEEEPQPEPRRRGGSGAPVAAHVGPSRSLRAAM